MLTKPNAIGPKIIISFPMPPIPKQESNSPATHPWSLLNTLWSFSLSCLFCLLMLEYPSSPYVFEKFYSFFKDQTHAIPTWKLLETSLYTSCFQRYLLFCGSQCDLLLSSWWPLYGLWAPLGSLGSVPQMQRCPGVSICPVHGVVSKILFSWMNIVVLLLLKFTRPIASIVK